MRFAFSAAASAVLLFSLVPPSLAGSLNDQPIHKVGGMVYKISFETVNGQEMLIYTDRRGKQFTKEQVKAMNKATSKICPDLQVILDDEKTPQSLSIILTLTDQPTRGVAKEMRDYYGDERKQITSELDALAQNAKLEIGNIESPDKEKNVASSRPLTDEEKKHKRQLLEDLDVLDQGINRQIGSAVLQTIMPQQSRVSALITSLGGEVLQRTRLMNAVAARIPSSALQSLEKDPDIMWIAPDILLETQMNDSICTIGADTSFWAGGYEGQLFEGGVLDTGIDVNHPAFAPKTLQTQVSLAAASGSSTFNDDASTVDDLQGHGSHVSGTVCSEDITNSGVARGDNNHVVVKAGFQNTSGDGSMYFSDCMVGVDWALMTAVDDADVFNLSFGGYASSDDDSFSRFWDSVVDDMATPVAISAGNSGPTGRVGTPSISYNCFSVANVDDKDDCNTSNDEWRSSSSIGPTLGYRMKPDLAAPGTDIRSANNDWEGASSDYVDKTGTSMAAPHVAGACVLLADYGITSPKEQKALLLNTARDRENIGLWNKYYGWGVLDLDHAWFHKEDVFTDSVKDTSGSAEERFNLYTGYSFYNDRATLVINRHATYDADYPADYFDLSTLTLFMYDQSDETQLDASSTAVHNVAVVENEVAPASVVLKVRSYGAFDHGSDTEEYALALEENFVPAEVDLDVSTTFTSTFGGFRVVRVEVTNVGNVKAHDITGLMDLPLNWSFVSGAGGFNMGNLEVGETGVRRFRCFEKVTGKSGAFGTPSATVESDSYDHVFSFSG